MISVVGANRRMGREVTARLAAAGRRVRAVVRRSAEVSDLNLPNVEIVEADLDDTATLHTALRGAERAFIVTPVGAGSVQWFRNFFSAVERAGTAHVVKVSAMGAGDPDSVILRQHGATDEMLRDSRIPYTILLPSASHQSLLRSAGDIKAYGTFCLPLQGGTQCLVDMRDVAAVAVEVLTGNRHEGQAYEITGSESLSCDDVADKLSQALGRRIQYRDVSPEVAKAALLKAGMSEWLATATMELYAVVARGKYDYPTGVVAQITGKVPITFQQFAGDYARLFQ
jgi:uncharacterized protein YbjT (DUF2867 family)